MSVAPSESRNGVRHSFCTTTSPIHNFLGVETERETSPFIQSESLGSPNQVRGYMIQPQKHFLKSGPSSPVSPSPNGQHPRSTFSRSSLFCTSLYLSSSSKSETQRQLGNLPFLPNPPTYNHSTSAVESAKSPAIFSEDLGNPYDDDQSEALMRDFLNIPGDTSDGSFHGMNCGNDSLALTEQMELQFLSEELDIAITDHGETPRIDVSTCQQAFVALQQTTI